MGKVPRYFSEEADPQTTDKSTKKLKNTLLSSSSLIPASTSVQVEIKPEIETTVASNKVIRKGWRNSFSKLNKDGIKKNKLNKKTEKKIKKKSGDKLSLSERDKTKEDEADGDSDRPPISKNTMDKYSRGQGLSEQSEQYIRTESRKAKLVHRDKKIKSGLEHAARSEVLLLEEPGGIEVGEGDHTLQLKQFDITKKVDIATGTKGFHLSLDQFGPYKISYTPNGRYLLMGGRKGHITAFDWVTKTLMCEMGVMESVHDVAWLHNENLFAVAQKEWTFIYDRQGIEIHCLKKMDRVMSLDFLPYHFLLAGGHQSGFISWVDVSIGKIVAQFNARHGPLGLLTTNPANAVVHCGHVNGTVTLWAPTVKKPLASILCHGCPVSAISIDNVGRLMATSGRDGTLRIWDLRNSFTPLTSVKVGAASSLNFSQRGLLALATSNQTMIFSEVGYKQKPYLKHISSSPVSSLKFCPFEDILGIGTDRGFDSVIIPGAGEPNFDAFERNPFHTKNQRQEAEVKGLLEKIQPELISLDNNILGEVDTETLKSTIDIKPKHIKKADIQLAHRKKRKNAKLPKIKEALRTELSLRMAKEQDSVSKRKKQVVDLPSDDPLARFSRKK